MCPGSSLSAGSACLSGSGMWPHVWGKGGAPSRTSGCLEPFPHRRWADIASCTDAVFRRCENHVDQVEVAAKNEICSSLEMFWMIWRRNERGECLYWLQIWFEILEINLEKNCLKCLDYYFSSLTPFSYYCNQDDRLGGESNSKWKKEFVSFHANLSRQQRQQRQRELCARSAQQRPLLSRAVTSVWVYVCVCLCAGYSL